MLETLGGPSSMWDKRNRVSKLFQDQELGTFRKHACVKLQRRSGENKVIMDGSRGKLMKACYCK